MRKRLQALLITILCLLCFCTQTSAEGNKLTVILNGNEIEFVQPPIIENGITLVPVREICKSINAALLWEKQTNTVYIFKNDNIISITINSSSALVNNNPFELEEPARIIDNKTYVPLNFIVELLGDSINFDVSTNTIYITTKNIGYEYDGAIPCYDRFTDAPDFGKIYNLKTVLDSKTDRDFNSLYHYGIYYRTDMTESYLNEYMQTLKDIGYSKMYESENFLYYGINPTGTIVYIELEDNFIHILFGRELNNDEL